MTPEQHDLYTRILAFSFDEGDPALPFAGRLARDNGWPTVYSMRVIDEYRKFAFLMAASGHLAVPSDQIDQAWHQHLQYTKSWADFCRTALGKTIDHEPTRGGQAEQERFKQGYERTLESYRRFFGEPPVDIWPPGNVRFGKDLHYRRVNTVSNVVIPQTRLWLLGLAAAVILAALLLAWLSY